MDLKFLYENLAQKLQTFAHQKRASYVTIRKYNMSYNSVSTTDLLGSQSIASNQHFYRTVIFLYSKHFHLYTRVKFPNSMKLFTRLHVGSFGRITRAPASCSNQ